MGIHSDPVECLVWLGKLHSVPQAADALGSWGRKRLKVMWMGLLYGSSLSRTWATLQELLQKGADAQCRKAKIKET